VGDKYIKDHGPAAYEVERRKKRLVRERASREGERNHKTAKRRLKPGGETEYTILAKQSRGASPTGGCVKRRKDGIDPVRKGVNQRGSNREGRCEGSNISKKKFILANFRKSRKRRLKKEKRPIKDRTREGVGK